jgi:hypothetical protein
MQPWLLLFVDNDHRLRWRHRQLRPLWIWLQLRREWRPGSRMHVFSWVRLDCDELECLRFNRGHVHDEWLRPRQRVRGRRSAASYVFLQPRLFVSIGDNHCMRWCHRQLRDVWSRLQLRREWRPGSRVHVFSWVRLDCDELERLRHNNVDVLDDRLRRRQRVRGRRSAARCLFLQPRLCVCIYYIQRLH